jgi:hypothetical protein
MPQEIFRKTTHTKKRQDKGIKSELWDTTQINLYIEEHTI